MRIGNRPGWAWFSPKDAPWWSPAAVHYALLTERISSAQALPRLAGGAIAFDDEWVDRFEDPWDAMVDDDPDVSRVPVATSWRWLELIADELEGDRADTARRMADPSQWEVLGDRSEKLRELHLFITTATVDDWPPSSWLSQGTVWFLNGGLLTPSTLLDLVEMQAQAAPQLLPGSQVFGVLAEPDEGDIARVVAAYEVGVEDPSSGVSRRAAIARLEEWLSGDQLSPLEVPDHLYGYTNKTASHGRQRGGFDW